MQSLKVDGQFRDEIQDVSSEASVSHRSMSSILAN